MAVVGDTYLTEVEAEMEANRLQKENKVRDLMQTLEKEENKLKEIKLKRDSIKEQVNLTHCTVITCLLNTFIMVVMVLF